MAPVIVVITGAISFMGSYRHLKVWRSAHVLACDVCRLTRTFPPTERFGLGDQLRRASISVGANIAEGCGRNGDRELARYLDIALGSANELEYLLELSRDLGVVLPGVADPLMRKARDVCRMLSGLQRAARREGAPTRRESPRAVTSLTTELRQLIADS